MSFFILWEDYDGHYIEEFEDRCDAEKRATEISTKSISNYSYGTHITKVIKGEELALNIEQISVVEFI